LDARLQRVDVEALAPPRTGWLAAVRLALGMSSADVGRRTRVSRQAVYALEASERAGTVRMSTMSAAAEAMGCQLVYALVPRTTLQGTVEAQAGRVVDALTAFVAHSMALEGQAVEPLPTDRQDAIDDLLRAPDLPCRRAFAPAKAGPGSGCDADRDVDELLGCAGDERDGFGVHDFNPVQGVEAVQVAGRCTTHQRHGRGRLGK
jgi:predicted DNA-binding mobile mystery protein A